MSEIQFYGLMFFVLCVIGLSMLKYLDGTSFSDIDRRSRFERSLISGELAVLDYKTIKERRVHKPGYRSATVYEIEATIVIPDQ